MYTDGSQATGHHRFIQHISTSCSCQRCVHHGQPACGRGGGPAYQPAPEARQTDHPSVGCRRDGPPPSPHHRVKGAGARALVADAAAGRSGRRSPPQRRPVFAGPDPRGRSGDWSLWDLNAAQWSRPPGHCPSVKEQCGCVARGDTAAHPFIAGVPHPLPHLQVRGQGYRRRRTVSYVTVEEEGEDCGCGFEGCHSEPRGPHLVGRIRAPPNGHCGPGTGFFEGGEETDGRRDRGGREGGSEEGCNGRGGSHKGFFPTEVPQRHLKQRQSNGPRVVRSGASSPATNGDHQSQGSDVARQKRREDLVRDKIRQVVTDLEDVLGGLKQVHVEMKEVVQQIDRLTARIDLGQEKVCITHAGASVTFHCSTHPDDHAAPQPPAAPVRARQRVDEDRIILRTNSPSPVHVASVVKTSRFTPPGAAKDSDHERTGHANGHVPHPHPLRGPDHVGQAHPEPRSQSLDPKVVICNSTSSSKTQKPPLYPQNGRCGKGPYLPPKPVRTPACPARGCQKASNV